MKKDNSKKVALCSFLLFWVFVIATSFYRDYWVLLSLLTTFMLLIFLVSLLVAIFRMIKRAYSKRKKEKYAHQKFDVDEQELLNWEKEWILENGSQDALRRKKNRSHEIIWPKFLYGIGPFRY